VQHAILALPIDLTHASRNGLDVLSDPVAKYAATRIAQTREWLAAEVVSVLAVNLRGDLTGEVIYLARRESAFPSLRGRCIPLPNALPHDIRNLTTAPCTVSRS
jgi:hypothetical protein